MKLIMKLFALPVLVILKVFAMLGNLLTSLSSLAIGLFLLLLGGLAVYCIVQQAWLNLAILAGMAVITFVVMFLMVAVIFKAEIWRDQLQDFIRS